MQNRKAPSFQEYAASMMANREFKLMSLPERGLLMTMRYECWENNSVPINVADLAKCLGFEVSEIKMALTSRVKHFFKEFGDSYICPELEDYREHLKDRKLKQSAGGKKGAKITNSAKSREAAVENAHIRTSNDSSNSRVTRQASRESLVKLNTNQLSKVNQNQHLDSNHIHRDFIDDYDSNDIDLS